MAITKEDRRLEQVSFSFDEAGDVSEVMLHVNYGLVDDATGQEEARVRRGVSVWDSLSQEEKDEANVVGKTFRALAETI